MLEIGFPPDRVYQAELQFEIEGKRYYSFYECDNKKMTQKKTAFDIVVKLYKERVFDIVSIFAVSLFSIYLINFELRILSSQKQKAKLF